MQSLPVNSPQAAARVLAMALVADGHFSMTELRALDRLDAPARLGLSPGAFKDVLDRFCQDLLTIGNGHWTGTVDPATREQLMAEITQPALQDLITQQCEALALADGHLADGEVDLLDALGVAWRRPLGV
ncbi:MAG: TerB family tellurite resistance protein [Hydrogenophaga sp.]|nr:TerB family tellurite resistance protein [Hydrogenophaga sp.]